MLVALFSHRTRTAQAKCARKYFSHMLPQCARFSRVRGHMPPSKHMMVPLKSVGLNVLKVKHVLKCLSELGPAKREKVTVSASFVPLLVCCKGRR